MSKNEKVLKQIENMKTQTFGVEVEMYNITRKEAATTAATFFGTNNFQYTGEYDGYSTWTAYDSQGRRWKFMSDSSIRDYNGGCELVTPILTYDADIATLQELIRQLRRKGAQSDAAHKCGVHIHIGAADHTPQSLRNLINIMASKEDLLSKAIGIKSERMRYCKVTSQRVLSQVNSKKPKTMQELKKIWYNDNQEYHSHYNETRYHMLNLHATFTKGTVEFRCFNFNKEQGRRSGLHAGLLKSWIQLCLAMSQQAKDVRTASSKMPQRENERFAMRTWMNRLGMIGDEFSTARKLLIKNLDGNAAWRYGNDQAA